MTDRPSLPEPLPLKLLPVHVAKVHIKDFRAIVELYLEFTTRLAVFVGDNQAGKTTVLRAIAAGLGNPISVADQASEWSSRHDARRTKASRTQPKVEVRLRLDLHELAENGQPVSRPVRQPQCAVNYFPAERRLEELFADFAGWFLSRDNEEAKRVRDTQDLGYRNPELEAVREAVRLLVPGATNLRTTGMNGAMVVDVQGSADQPSELEVKDLSGGVRIFLAMVVTIARTLIDADPKLGTSGPGIVFIDEIDLHLHPSWQQRVLPGLLRTFPGVQFFVTTHSEQVVSSVPSECIYVLSRGPDGVTANAPPAVEGAAAERILEDVMGVSKRPKDVEAQLAAYFDLIARDQGESDDAKDIRVWLDERFQGRDPDLVSADFEIRRRKHLRKASAG